MAMRLSRQIKEDVLLLGRPGSEVRMRDIVAARVATEGSITAATAWQSTSRRFRRLREAGMVNVTAGNLSLTTDGWTLYSELLVAGHVNRHKG